MKKRLLVITDSIKRKSGYATVARAIIGKLLKTGKYQIAQLGLADSIEPLPLPIEHYTSIKVHNDCCKRGALIEYTPISGPIQYIEMTPAATPHADQKTCTKGVIDRGDNYGFGAAYFVIQHFKPDIVLPINDIWGLHNLVYTVNRNCYKLVPYLAIDSDCMFPKLSVPNAVGLPPIDTATVLLGSDKTVLFTEWSHKVLKKTLDAMGVKKEPNIEIIPHGVHSSQWKPLNNKAELRAKYFGNIPKNAILIGTINRNQPRKRLDAVMQAVKTYKDRYEKNRPIYVYFHCAVEDEMGWPLPWLANYYGILDRCLFDMDLRPGNGPAVEQLNEIANCFDLHVLISNSEGFGLTAIETMSAGIPNIVTSDGAMADWTDKCAIVAKPAAFEHEPKTGFVKVLVDVNDVAKNIHLLTNSSLGEQNKMHKEYSILSRKLAERLDWDKIGEKWVTLLDNLDTSDLKPNRYDSIPAIVATPENLRVAVLPDQKKLNIPNY